MVADPDAAEGGRRLVGRMMVETLIGADGGLGDRATSDPRPTPASKDRETGWLARWNRVAVTTVLPLDLGGRSLDPWEIAGHGTDMPTTPLAPGGQVALPPALVQRLRLRDGRPASLLHAEMVGNGVLLSPVEPRDLPESTLRGWVAEGEVQMEAFRKGRA